MRQFFYFLCASLMLASFSAVAVEPTNLFITIQKLKKYHDSGEYEKDIDHVNAEALRYLKTRIANNHFKGKPAIVLDIDETALSNYKNMEAMRFGGTLAQIREAIDRGEDPAIASTLKLFNYAKAHHLAVIFITGRLEEGRAVTITNLNNAGYHDWDKLVLRSNAQRHDHADVYKTAIRKELANEGYDILLNVGDQQSDLSGGYADKTFKLPNPYYFIP